VVAPFTGVLVDRIDRRRAMIISDAGAAVATGAIMLLLMAGRLEMWHILVAAFALSVFNTIQWPAWSAAQSLLVPKEHLGRSSGMVQIGDALSSLLAPAMAGMLFVTIGLTRIIVIDLLTFAFAVTCLLVVRIPLSASPTPSAEEAARPRPSILSDASFGLRYIWARKPLLGLLLYFATANFLLAGFGPLIGPLLLDIASPEQFGVIQSIIGLGMLAGTLTMSAWGGAKRKVNSLLGFGGLAGLAMLALGARLWVPLIVAGGFVMMFAFPISGASSQAIWQRKTDPKVQGRVFASRRVIAWSTTIPGNLLAALLVERVFDPLMAASGPLAGTALGGLLTLGPGRGTGVYFMITGALAVLAAAAFYLIPQVRHVEALIPDAVGETPPADVLDAPPEALPQAEAAAA
jgi:MFS family permease